MSHSHTVPDGWVKGEPLELIGTGPNCALDIARAVGIGEYCKRFQDSGRFMITFDSEKDRQLFLDWWYGVAVFTSIERFVDRGWDLTVGVVGSERHFHAKVRKEWPPNSRHDAMAKSVLQSLTRLDRYLEDKTP